MPRSRRQLGPIIQAPGYGSLITSNAIAQGAMLRDQWLYQLPLMFEAVSVYQQMASGRDYKVSGTPRGVTRCVEWLNGALTVQYDGIECTGFDDLEKRRSLDHLTIGRTILYAPDDGPLQYLDPTTTFFDYEEKLWYSTLTGKEYKKDFVHVNHAFPIGSTGYFVAPLMPVVSAGMLAFLVQEHDKASLDGRRIRDVIIMRGQDTADQAVTAMKQMIEQYTEPDVTKHNIPVVYFEDNGTGVSAKDIVARIGLSEIPEGFNRTDFEFGYVNRIAAALGISLRHFWNSEKATNRALEEVQEARQAQKGPSYFVRNDERIFNNRKILQRFGRNIRINMIEEVDVQSRETNAKVLLAYAQAVGLLNGLAPGQVNVKGLIAFLQRDDILPVDVDLIDDSAPKQSIIQESNQQVTPGNGSTSQQGNPEVSIQKSYERELDYDEITMDLNGRILERRHRTYTIEKALAEEYENDPVFQDALRDEQEDITPNNLLEKAHQFNLEEFLKAKAAKRRKVINELPPELAERAKSFKLDSRLNDEDHRLIASLVMKLWEYDEN